jgi:hypothetical protein
MRIEVRARRVDLATLFVQGISIDDADTFKHGMWPTRRPREKQPRKGIYIQGIAGNKKGEFGIEAQLLSNLHANNG